MLHCLQSPENLAGTGTDMTLLERQRARLKWQHHPQQQEQGEEESQFNDTHLHVLLQFQGENESITVKPDPDLENGYAGSGNYPMPITSFGGSELYAEMGCSVGKKRKCNKNQQNPKIVGSEDSNDKRMRGTEGEDTSKLTEQTNTRENSGDNSRDNSKISEPQKPDYIHVRARRGQATDSHSLAERVRREKISERMKYLQELVPGCNKIIGKAGMLDEIINYVQSLQKQVEFLSMKLATVSPRLDFNIEDLFNKEMLPYCTNNISTVGALSEMINPAYFQFNPVVSCGLDMGSNPPEMAPERARSTGLSVPETFLESPCFSHTPPASTWDNDLQSIYNVAFNHGRPIDFPSQPFTGSLAANNLKMEM